MTWVILLLLALLVGAVWWLRRGRGDTSFAKEPTLFGKDTTKFDDGKDE